MINIKDTLNQKLYFTSDLHLGHDQKFIYETRGFSSVKDHTSGIIDSINNVVSSNDILFMLGDFCLNSNTSQFEEYISRINCQNIYMLFGNHPNRHFKEIYIPMVKNILGNNYTEDSEVYPLRYKNVVYYGNHQELIWNGQFIVLNHFPLYSWNYMKKGSWMFHGHEHSAVNNHLPTGTDGKILDLSWDYFKSPLSFSQIKPIMDNKKIISVGHH